MINSNNQTPHHIYTLSPIPSLSSSCTALPSTLKTLTQSLDLLRLGFLAQPFPLLLYRPLAHPLGLTPKAPSHSPLPSTPMPHPTHLLDLLLLRLDRLDRLREDERERERRRVRLDLLLLSLDFLFFLSLLGDLLSFLRSLLLLSHRAISSPRLISQAAVITAALLPSRSKLSRNYE